MVARPATAAESSRGELGTGGVTWTEEGTHKGCPYGDSKSRLDQLRTHVFAGRHTSIMRTTIDIATPILEELKSIQKKEGGTLGELVTGLLAEGLHARYVEQTDPELDWISHSMGARVDLADKEAVYAIIDDDGS